MLNRKSFLSGLLLICFGCWGWSQNFTLEQIMGTPFPTELTAHPTENAFAWVFNEEGERNIWLYDGEGSRELTRYRKDDGQEIQALKFSPNGAYLLFEKGGSPNRSGELPNPTSEVAGVKRMIYLIDLADETVKELAEGFGAVFLADNRSIVFQKENKLWKTCVENCDDAEMLLTIRGGISELTPSPVDEEWIAFTNRRGDHSFIALLNWLGKEVKFINPGFSLDASPVWSPDGRFIVFSRRRVEKDILPFASLREGIPWSIMRYEIANEECKKLWEADTGPGSIFRSISADQQLMITATNEIVFPWEKDGWTHLYALPDTGGSARLLTPGSFEVQFVSLSADKEDILFSSNDGDIDRQHLWKIHFPQKNILRMSHGTGIEWSPVQNGAGEIACLASTAVKSAHPYLVNGDELTMQAMAPLAVPADFPMFQLVEPEQVVFYAADSTLIHGQLFLPRNRQPDYQYPAVMFFHGGSKRQMLLGFHHRGYYHNAYAFNQYLANKGFIVLSVNYRSGIGYGMEFREALNYGAQGASEYLDVLAGARFLQDKPYVDSSRVGLWGGSYGGYLTALGLARNSGIFAAGVDIHGVHDWNVVIKNFVPDYNPLEKPDFARLAFKSSPMADIDEWRSPVLIIHGDDDRNVPFSESVDLVEALSRQGVYFEELVFPDEVHGFLLYQNWIRAYENAADFFDRMLKK